MTNFAGGWIAGNAHIINPRTPVKHRETAARQPRNSRNTLCETRETRRETARDSRETAANLMRNRVANSLHLELLTVSAAPVVSIVPWHVCMRLYEQQSREPASVYRFEGKERNPPTSVCCRVLDLATSLLPTGREFREICYSS